MSVQEVIYYVVTCGSHLEIPLICPKLLQDELIKCWSYDPNARPSFHYLFNFINELPRDMAQSDSSNDSIQRVSSDIKEVSTIQNSTRPQSQIPKENDNEELSLADGLVTNAKGPAHGPNQGPELSKYSVNNFPFWSMNV